jgi:uncharacterized MAPEG superfamily protein
LKCFSKFCGGSFIPCGAIHDVHCALRELAVEISRTYLVLAKGHRVTQFKPDGADVSPFMYRLCRAHANCVENFPIFGGFLILALVTQQTKITDGLALYFLAARFLQSITHLISSKTLAINLRLMFYAIQLIIGCIWLFGFVHIFITKL